MKGAPLSCHSGKGDIWEERGQERKEGMGDSRLP